MKDERREKRRRKSLFFVSLWSRCEIVVLCLSVLGVRFWHIIRRYEIKNCALITGVLFLCWADFFLSFGLANLSWIRPNAPEGISQRPRRFSSYQTVPIVLLIETRPLTTGRRPPGASCSLMKKFQVRLPMGRIERTADSTVIDDSLYPLFVERDRRLN